MGLTDASRMLHLNNRTFRGNFSHLATYGHARSTQDSCAFIHAVVKEISASFTSDAGEFIVGFITPTVLRAIIEFANDISKVANVRIHGIANLNNIHG